MRGCERREYYASIYHISIAYRASATRKRHLTGMCTQRRLRRVPDSRREAGRRQTENAGESLLSPGGLTDGFAGVHQRYSVLLSFVFCKDGGSKPPPYEQCCSFLLCHHVSGARYQRINSYFVRRLGSRGGTPLGSYFVKGDFNVFQDNALATHYNPALPLNCVELPRTRLGHKDSDKYIHSKR